MSRICGPKTLFQIWKVHHAWVPIDELPRLVDYVRVCAAKRLLEVFRDIAQRLPATEREAEVLQALLTQAPMEVRTSGSWQAVMAHVEGMTGRKIGRRTRLLN